MNKQHNNILITEYESIAMKEGRALPADPPKVYKLSDNNWRHHWAAMGPCLDPDCKISHVIMWIPRNTPPPFNFITSGRQWESIQGENK